MVAVQNPRCTRGICCVEHQNSQAKMSRMAAPMAARALARRAPAGHLRTAAAAGPWSAPSSISRSCLKSSIGSITGRDALAVAMASGEPSFTASAVPGTTVALNGREAADMCADVAAALFSLSLLRGYEMATFLTCFFNSRCH